MPSPNKYNVDKDIKNYKKGNYYIIKILYNNLNYLMFYYNNKGRSFGLPYKV